MRERRPFQIGDRVRFYSGNAIWIANIDAILAESGLVRASNNGQWFHVKQVRRLVRKPKERVWTLEQVMSLVFEAELNQIKGILGQMSLASYIKHALETSND